MPRISADEFEELQTGELVVKEGLLGNVADRVCGRRQSVTRSCPHTRTAPPIGRNSPVSILIVVVLPAPFGPKSANNSPDGTVSVKRSTASLWA